jgi:alkylation response protein AidB-like acyl-CoA dehydrogenase
MTAAESSHPVLERTKAIAAQVEAQAADSEKNRTFTPELVDLMINTGLVKCFLPKVAGGDELSMAQLIPLWIEMARQYGSFGWIGIANGPSTAFAAAYLPEEGFRTVFADKKSVCMGGQFFPNGQGNCVEGGYSISGAWQFGSGSYHSDYICGGFFPMQDGQMLILPNGFPDMRVAIIPRESITFTDNWHVLGLKGTGSFDYTTSEVFVPEYMTYPLFTKNALRGGPLYNMGIMPYTAAGHGGWALGIARRMLDETNATARAKIRMGDANTIAHKTTFQKNYATAEAKYAAANLWMTQVFVDAEAKQAQIGNAELDVQTRAQMRLAASYATEVAKEIVDTCHLMTGTAAIREAQVMERFFRDMHTGTQHAFISEKLFTDAAEIMLGIATENFAL